MATFNLFGGASLAAGNGNANAGNFISGVCFTVTTGGCWLTGYQYYVVTGLDAGPTTPQKFALWCATSSSAGTLVPGSVVTSGTLTAGAWNTVNLPTPIPLAIGTMYVAATGVNGNFCQLKNQFGSGNPFSAGITSGPLFGYSDTTGTAPAQYSFPQGVFSTGGSDPSTTLPSTGSSSGNFGIDVNISNTAPVGYTGSYRLWPNKFDSNPSTVLDSAINYDICTEVRLSQACTLNRIWCFSTSGAFSLPTAASVWSIASGLQVATTSSPSWISINGGAAVAGGGWMYTAFGSTTLAAGNYRVGVFNAGGTGGGWGSTDISSDYWGAGTGGSGITNGPLSAPNLASASSGFLYNASLPGNTPPYGTTAHNAQGVFGQTPGGTDIFPQLWAPGTAGVSQNYWADMEVTPLPGPSLPAYLAMPGGYRFLPASGGWPLSGAVAGGALGWFPV